MTNATLKTELESLERAGIMYPRVYLIEKEFGTCCSACPRNDICHYGANMRGLEDFLKKNDGTEEE